MRTTIYPPASKESAASADIAPIGDSSAVDTADLDLEPASFSDAAAVAVSSASTSSPEPPFPPLAPPLSGIGVPESSAIYAFHSLSLIEAAVKVSAFPLLPVIYLISCGVASSHSFPL